MINVNPKIACAVVAAAFGIVAVTVGFWPAIIVAILAGAGWMTGKWISGELGVVDEYIGRFFDSRRNRE